MWKKVIIGLLVFVVVLVGVAIAIPFVFKDEINAKVKEEINKQLDAKVEYGDFDLTILPSFPNLTFKLKDFSIVGKGDFLGDTLVSIDDFGITLDIMTVINKEKYKILAISLDKPVINAIVNKSGKANWDIYKSTNNTQNDESQNFALEVKKYSITDGNITYNDQPGNSKYVLQDLDFTGSGDVTQDLYKLTTNTSIASLDAKNAGVNYLNSVKVTASNEIEVDNKNNKYSFKNNEINLNDLTLLFDGFVKLNDKSTDLDVAFKSKQADFKSILSMIPAIYKKDFDKIKTSGSLKLDGSLKGTYIGNQYPAAAINLVVGNAMFQYPSLPTAVRNINIDAHLNKPQGDLDLLKINIPKLHADIGADPIDAVINIATPISDPNIDAKVKGRLNLADVPKYYPLEGVSQISGLLNADVAVKTRMSDIEKKNYQAINASGTAQITNLVYAAKDLPKTVNMSIMQLAFTPQTVLLNSLKAKIGSSDFNATGKFDNFLGYLFNKGPLVAKVSNTSTVLDVNEWIGNTPTGENTKATATKNDYFKVPTTIDLDAQSTFGVIKYDKLLLTNAKGNVTMHDEQINLNNISANLLGGNALISAVYATPNGKTPKVNFVYDVNNFDFEQTYKFVGMADKIAPLFKYLQGNFSTDMKGVGALKEDMSLDYNSLTGDGKLEIPTAKIVNMPMLQKIAEVAKIKQLNNLQMTNAWTLLQFKDGKVDVQPFDIKFGNGYLINLKGKNGFDQTIDYDLRFDLPSKELGPYANELVNKIPKIPGVPIAMPETFSMFLKVGGTAAKPTVKLTKVDAGKNSVKDMATNAVNDLKGKAEAEAAALKAKAEAEAKAKSEELKAKAQQEADKIKQQAQQQIKTQTDQIKKDAEQKAKDAVKGIKWPF